ncbi:uncharacterized protein MYCFIDRAFT_170746 [Pseudocercospora fijiensis CIRAD86]|uniref:Uncharacterized protein n=1 Tax=Pseudocercospora fijiensis (strain CIRAD86) TaxID=383855 RepID=N1QCR1_PSEFD|nr:uncharacterized protein MYCFIDRAFT_170746 [Pseudocercospora fijiensis CIRAD86]EME89253.1 hypothetical protein MYCFIDRAFT_170746 [Pseudocercospora fijiensis CIRAD86]
MILLERKRQVGEREDETNRREVYDLFAIFSPGSASSIIHHRPADPALPCPLPALDNNQFFSPAIARQFQYQAKTALHSQPTVKSLARFRCAFRISLQSSTTNAKLAGLWLPPSETPDHCHTAAPGVTVAVRIQIFPSQPSPPCFAAEPTVALATHVCASTLGREHLVVTTSQSDSLGSGEKCLF